MPDRTRILALLACFSSAISATRIILAGGPPNVKPVAFLSIVGGIIGGLIFGFVAGALGMAVSDLFFGVGPWTPVTSCGMAVIGFLGALSAERSSACPESDLQSQGSRTQLSMISQLLSSFL